MKKIWLFYQSMPYTTATYYLRALKKRHQVITIGTYPNDSFFNRWNQNHLKNRIQTHDIHYTPDTDIKSIKQALNHSSDPDLYIWIESGEELLPNELNRLSCPKVAIFIDSHLYIDYQLKWGSNFDYVFIAQAEYLDIFKSKGINTFWLPLAADLEIHKKYVLPKIHSLGTAASVFAGTRREDLIKKIASRFDIAVRLCFLEEMAKLYSQSKLIFNNAIKNDMNMRVFEAMSTGSALLTDLAKNSGQDILFYDHQDLIIYSDENILDKTEYFLKNDAKRERIAAQGRELVINAHQYSHRVDDMLDIVFNNKLNTFSAEELRKKSLGPVIKPSFMNMETKENSIVSFIIPVLDYSPASQFNIKTLLDDLANITGDVIIIFNNSSIAEQLKDHSRITRYAVMSQNVGVSRAWNIGLNLSITKFNFILNADLHLGPAGVKKLLDFMIQTPKAAIVGPQGAFFNFETLKDFYFFDKKSFGFPIQVDAVSGFYFLVNKELLDDHGIQFDVTYTPCYREEWDIGLQLRRARLACFIVPINDYEHQWSGSINSYKKIQYLGQEEDLGKILQRTGATFHTKWKKIASQSTLSLESLWKPFALKSIEDLIRLNKLEQARGIVNILLGQFPSCKLTLASAGLVEYHLGHIQESLSYFNKSLLIDPGYLVAKQNIELIQSRQGKIG
jgi:hypothetical protein